MLKLPCDEIVMKLSTRIHVDTWMRLSRRGFRNALGPLPSIKSMFCIEAGGHSVTPSEVPHALKTADTPVLTLFVWTADLASPIWWWVHDEAGNRTKTITKKP